MTKYNNDPSNYLAEIFIQAIDNPDEETQQMIFRGAAQYFLNYHNQYGNWRVLGMQGFVPLEAIYTELKFLEEFQVYEFPSKNYIKNLSKPIYSFTSDNSHREEVITVINKIRNRCLRIIGTPGSGKTIFLRKIGLEALKGKQGAFNYECIPVFIELKRFDRGNYNIESLIIQEFKRSEFSQPEQLAYNLLEIGKLLVLIDDLEEVPTIYLNYALKIIEDFRERWSGNRIIISSRTAACYPQLSSFTNVEIAEFDDQQIEQFIYKWFQTPVDTSSKTAKNCWKLLKNEPSTKALAKSPLMLTFLCRYYQKNKIFIKDRSQLYQETVDRWLTGKRVKYDQVSPDFNKYIEKNLLASIAYQGFKKDRFYVTKQELIEQIQANLRDKANAPQDLNIQEILRTMQANSGILKPIQAEENFLREVEAVYGFSHLTLQEYLTAEYIKDQELLEEVVAKYLTNQRWKEVFLLLAELMPTGADKLLLLMEKEAQKLINTPKLTALLEWVERETADSEADIKPVGKRAIANAFVFAFAIGYSITNAFAITNSDVRSYAEAYVNTNSITYTNPYAYIIANAYMNANVNANAISIANAIAYIIAYANAIANPWAYAYITAYGIQITTTIAEAIEKSREFANLNAEIFKSLNFSLLIPTLETASKIKIPQDMQSPAERREFTNFLFETLLKPFNLMPEMLDLFKDELIAWDNYLYANYLILQCKQAAVRLSPKNWEEIEDRMLRVISD